MSNYRLLRSEEQVPDFIIVASGGMAGRGSLQALTSPHAKVN